MTRRRFRFNPIVRKALIAFLASLPALPPAGWAQEAAAPANEDAGPGEPAAQGAPQAPASFTGLLVPRIAQRLGLTADQRSRIEELLNQRQRQLDEAAARQASDEERSAIIAANERALAEVLDARQQEAWQTYWSGEAQEPQIRFSFRFQPWADVLNWFAERAGLSLVLDAPPPGTFNYSDSRSYTTSEAIDLLNGVLLTKGYTLLRRERMLMLIELAEGVPDELVPRIELDELEQRGKYELVSVLFPIGDRNPDEVNTEIRPLLGPHGKSAPLPRTRQLLVTETAGRMRAIKAVIDSIPGQPQRSPAEAPREPDKPGLATYPLETITPQAAVDVLKTLFPEVKVVADPATGQLAAYAPAAQQAAIKSVLEQMQAELPAERKPVLRTYEIKPSALATLASVLASSLPEVRLTQDPARGRIFVWAIPPDHDRVEAAIAELEAGAGDENRPTLETYPLARPLTPAELSLLSTLVGEGKVTLDDARQRLLVLAAAHDQRAVAEALVQLESPADDREVPRLVVYPLGAELEPKVAAALEALATELPGLRRVPLAEPGELAIWARPAQHELMAALVEQLRTETPESQRRTIVAYRPAIIDPANLANVLARLVPQALVVVDAKSRQLVAFARPAEHEQIRQTLVQMDAEGPAGSRLELRSHPLRAADGSAAVSVLSNLLPEVRVINDTKAQALVVWASQEDQEVVAETIARMQPEIPDDIRPRLEVYPTRAADPAALASLLSPLFPQARFSGDRTTSNLAAWATPAEHEQIRIAVEQMQAENDPEFKRTLMVYSLEPAEAANVQTLLAQVLPTAIMRLDASTGKLVVWARPEEHETVRHTLDKLGAEGDAQAERVLGVYPLNGRDATAVLGILQPLVPSLKFVPDARSGSLLTWARPDQHELLKKTLAQIEHDLPRETLRTTRVYRLRSADPTAAQAALQTLLPETRIVIDAKRGQLVATADPDGHAQIEATIAQLEGSVDPAQAEAVRVYELRSADPATVLAVARELFASRPEVRISLDPKTDKLVAWAAPEQHATLSRLLEELDGGAGPEHALQLEVHRLGTADGAAAYQVLSALVAKMPGARLLGDAKSGQIAALARPEEQAAIRATIDQLQAAAPEVEVFPLRVLDPYAAEFAISKLFGSDKRDNPLAPQVDADATSQQLFVRATKEQLEQIRAVLVKMGERGLSSPLAGSDRRTRVIAMTAADAAKALEEIRRVWPLLRTNPLEVVTPSAVAPTVRRARRQSGSADQTPALAPAADAADQDRSQPRDQTEQDARPAPPRASSPRQPVVRPAGEQPGDSQSRLRPSTLADAEGLLAAALETPGEAASPPAREPRAAPARDDPQATGSQSAPAGEASRDEGEDGRQAEAAEGDQPAAEPPPPIVIAPGRDGLTISSDDTEALDQLEALINEIAKERSAGREFTVIQLQTANALVVADTLAKFFESSTSFFGGAPPVNVVADQRLNALIVRANPNDLATIQRLVDVLDSADVAESAAAARPERIELRHARAIDVATVLRDVYRQQLTRSRTSGPGGPVPPGLSRDVAAVLQQMQRQDTGPEMSMSIDEATNSLVVMAAGPLLAEVKALVESLDRAAENAGQTVRVVPLFSTDADAVQRTLERIFRERGRGRRGFSTSE